MATASKTTSASSKSTSRTRSSAKKAQPAIAEFDKDEELHAYREMLLIRRFEEKAGQLYGMGLIGGFCHLYIGQEAVVVGLQMAKKDGDQMITGYRDHGHMLAMDLDPKGVMAELTGRRGGLSKGKGGSMHMFSKEKHFYGGHGIVGAQVSLGTAINEIRALEQRIGLPPTVSTSFGGTAAAFEESLANMGLLLFLAILVVYLVLGILYESFIHPLTILSGLPAAGLGALLALMAFGLPLTLYAFVGVIMLVGIVKKNAIMMIDFALQAQRSEGKAPDEAIYQACLLRFRPIMMTTFAALAGALPIALGHGAGAEARAPLGITVVGGLAVSQIITLYLTPVIYLYLDRLQRLLSRPRQAEATGDAAAQAG